MSESIVFLPEDSVNESISVVDDILEKYNHLRDKKPETINFNYSYIPEEKKHLDINTLIEKVYVPLDRTRKFSINQPKEKVDLSVDYVGACKTIPVRKASLKTSVFLPETGIAINF